MARLRAAGYYWVKDGVDGWHPAYFRGEPWAPYWTECGDDQEYEDRDYLEIGPPIRPYEPDDVDRLDGDGKD